MYARLTSLLVGHYNSGPGWPVKVLDSAHLHLIQLNELLMPVVGEIQYICKSLAHALVLAA